MELLFKREQREGQFSGVYFKLWGKVELTEEEQALVDHYRFKETVMVEVVQPTLIKQTAVLSFLVFIVAYVLVSAIWNTEAGLVLGVMAGVGFGYWYLNEKRETIFVKDLLHGRYFQCDSVIELAQKEAWLTTVVSFLRQVMENAKNWDGTEAISIEPLPKDEARRVMLKGI